MRLLLHWQGTNWLLGVCGIIAICVTTPVSAAIHNDTRMVIDVSERMKTADQDGRLRRHAGHLLIDSLPSGARAGIWTYGRYVNMQVPLRDVNGAWKQMARQKLNTLTAWGPYANLPDALQKAMAYWRQPEPNTRRQLIIVTGSHSTTGASLHSRAAEDILFKQIAPRLKKNGVKVNIVALSGKAQHLKKLSDATGGYYRVAENKQAVRVAMRSFLSANMIAQSEKAQTREKQAKKPKLKAVSAVTAQPGKKQAKKNNVSETSVVKKPSTAKKEKVLTKTKTKAKTEAKLPQKAMTLGEFTIGPNTKDVVVLVHDSVKGGDFALVSPDNKILNAKRSSPSGVWTQHGTINLITIKNPKAGKWHFSGKKALTLNFSVLKNIRLKAEKTPEMLFKNEAYDVNLSLFSSGKKITDSDILSFLNLTLKKHFPAQAVVKMKLFDDGEAHDNHALDGNFQKQLPVNDFGDLTVAATAKLGKMQYNWLATIPVILSPVVVKVERADNAEKMHHITLQEVVGVDKKSLAVHASIRNGKSVKKVMLTKNKQGLFDLELNALTSKSMYRVQLTVTGKTAQGRRFHVRLDPIQISNNVKPAPVVKKAKAVVLQTLSHPRLLEVKVAVKPPKISQKIEPGAKPQVIGKVSQVENTSGFNEIAQPRGKQSKTDGKVKFKSKKVEPVHSDKAQPQLPKEEKSKGELGDLKNLIEEDEELFNQPESGFLGIGILLAVVNILGFSAAWLGYRWWRKRGEKELERIEKELTS